MIETLPREIEKLYPFEAHWVEVGGYRLHYVDEGPRDADAVVLLHGNPTWSFLYREIIPRIVEAGLRVVAPDFLGSGRSDHARSEAEYAIVHHAARTLAVLDHAGVERGAFFLQDWGGPTALGMALVRPRLLAAMVLGNTFWGVSSVYHRRVYPWRTLHAPVAGPLLFGRRPVFIDGARLGMPQSLAPEALHAYRLPFEAQRGPGSTLAWPRAIALGPESPTWPLAQRIWEAMPELDVPTRFVWGAADVVFPWKEQGIAMRDRLPRGAEHEPCLVPEGRHFVQEYAPAECAEALVAVAREAFA